MCTIAFRQGQDVDKVKVHGFNKEQMHWNNCCTITTCGKIPLNWEKLGKHIAYMVVYLIKVYDILASLVVNIDQISKYVFLIDYEE